MHLSAAVTGVLVLVAVAAAGPGVSWMQGITPFATCSYPKQVICSNDCTELQLCVSDGAGGAVPQPVEVCNAGNGEKCSRSRKACVAAANSDCHETVTNFVCNDAGAFPDPYDCTVYHVCLKEGDTAAMGKCTDQWAWNPATYDCSLRTSDDVCSEGPITGCENAGDVGIVERNPSVYYLCVRSNGVLYPDMHKCHHGQIFDERIVGCRDRSEDDDEDDDDNVESTTSILQTGSMFL